MTNEGLGLLLRFVQHAFDQVPASRGKFEVWRTILAEFGDNEMLDIAAAHADADPEKAPTAVVLAGRARVARHEKAVARATEFAPQVSTMLTGHSRYPRRSGEPLGDYLLRLNDMLHPVTGGDDDASPVHDRGSLWPAKA